MGIKVTYKTIKQTFEENKCQLLTTENEFNLNNLNTRSKYKIIATCGHEIENCWYNMFMYRGSGKICKNCINKNASKKNIKLNENIYGNSYALQIEHKSIQLIKKYVNDTLEIKVSPECCLADIAIHDNSSSQNKHPHCECTQGQSMLLH